MKLIWSLKTTPEVARLPANERGRLVRQLVRRGFQHWQMYFAIGLAGAGAAAGWLIGEQYGAPLAGLILGSFAGSLGGNLIINQFVYFRFIKNN